MLAIPLSALTLEQASVLSPEHLTHLSRLLFVCVGRSFTCSYKVDDNAGHQPAMNELLFTI
ncbi:hypothetical protein BvCmsNSNP027_02649 [Escherichia coli]|nr:hypothetical protein BvCmsHHP001_00740 [Escherichia coli]GDN88950.1 hypothetical protein BvCmsNSNP027_02649 [Escherichia coli]